MEQILSGLIHGIDVSSYLDPNFTREEMRKIRLQLESKNI